MSVDPLSSAWSRLALWGPSCQAGHAEDGLGLFSGLVLGIASALPPSHNSEVAPCNCTTPVTTRQRPLLPLVVKCRKCNPRLLTFYCVCEGFLSLILRDDMEAVDKHIL